jgi:Uma2 family endonuclease
MQGSRRPRGFVISNPSPEELGDPIDWSSWYLTDEDDRSRPPQQEEAARVMSSSLATLARERGGAERAGRDELFAWVPAHPLVRVSPDAFVMPAAGARPVPAVWEIWRPGHAAPRFALEIVVEDWQRDYVEAPLRYWQLGARELAIFDPAVIARAPGVRVPLQLYRRDEDGAFVRVHAGSGPAESRELGAWLVVLVHGEGPSARLRVARDAAGAELVPTEDEARRAEEEARSQAARGLERVGEEMARSEAEREIARLRDELARERREREAARAVEEAGRSETAKEMARLREELARRG